MSGKSRFTDLAQDSPIEVFELTRQYNDDTNLNKVNLGVGCNLFILFYFLIK